MTRGLEVPFRAAEIGVGPEGRRIYHQQLENHQQTSSEKGLRSVVHNLWAMTLFESQLTSSEGWSKILRKHRYLH